MKHTGKTALILAALMALSACGNGNTKTETTAAQTASAATTTTAAADDGEKSAEAEATTTAATQETTTTTEAEKKIEPITIALTKASGYYPYLSDFRNGKVLIGNDGGHVIKDQKSAFLFMDESGELTEFKINSDKELDEHDVEIVGNNKYLINLSSDKSGTKCFIADENGDPITKDFNFKDVEVDLCNTYFVVRDEYWSRATMVGAMDYDGNWISKWGQNALTDIVSKKKGSVNNIDCISGDRYILIHYNEDLTAHYVIYDFDTEKIVLEFTLKDLKIAGLDIRDKSWSTSNGIYIPVVTEYNGTSNYKSTCILKADPSTGEITKMLDTKYDDEIACCVGEESVSVYSGQSGEGKTVMYDPDLNKICDVPNLTKNAEIFETPDGFVWSLKENSNFFDKNGTITNHTGTTICKCSKHSQFYSSRLVSGGTGFYYITDFDHNTRFCFPKN